MKRIFICRILALSFTMVFLWASQAFAHTEEKKIRRSFPVNEKTVIEVGTKYGKVDVQSWNVDSVSFRITIKAHSKTKLNCLDMLEETDVDFSSTIAYVVANTQFEDEGTQILSTLNSIASSWTNGKTEVIEVNYSIMVPASNPVEITTKFGDVNIGNRTGTVKIEAVYGDVKMGNIEGYADLKLKFADLNAQVLKRLNIVCEYGNIIIFKADNIDISSKSCQINLHEVERLRSRSKRDDFTIYKAGSINSNGHYSDFVLTELKGSLNFTGKYGQVVVHNVKPSFTSININCENSTTNLSFDKECQFAIDLHLEDGDFSYPMNMVEVTEKSQGEGEVNYYGRVGTSTSPRSSLEVFGEDTDVNITVN